MTSIPYPSEPLQSRVAAPFAPAASSQTRRPSPHGQSALNSQRHLLSAAERLSMADATARLRPLVHRVNGLITNDKLCLSRTQQLHLSWQRMPPSYARPPLSSYPPQKKTPRGGSYASTKLPPTPSSSASPRWAAPVGSRLPTADALEYYTQPSSTPTEPSGGHPCK